MCDLKKIIARLESKVEFMPCLKSLPVQSQLFVPALNCVVISQMFDGKVIAATAEFNSGLKMIML
jgi:hypothetical protein